MRSKSNFNKCVRYYLTMFGYLDNLRSSLLIFVCLNIHYVVEEDPEVVADVSVLVSGLPDAAHGGEAAGRLDDGHGDGGETGLRLTPSSQRGLWMVLFGSKLCMWDHN